MSDQSTTVDKANRYMVALPLLTSLYAEFDKLAKKKPDAVLNKQKLKAVKRIVDECRVILEGESSLQFLDEVHEDDIPQNSDTLLLLSQYSAAMKSFKGKYYGFDGREHRWFVCDGDADGEDDAEDEDGNEDDEGHSDDDEDGQDNDDKA